MFFPDFFSQIICSLHIGMLLIFLNRLHIWKRKKKAYTLSIDFKVCVLFSFSTTHMSYVRNNNSTRCQQQWEVLSHTHISQQCWEVWLLSSIWGNSLVWMKAFKCCKNQSKDRQVLYFCTPPPSHENLPPWALEA